MTAPTRLLDEVVARAATVVEASAGTGKTYQLEQLTLGLVAEGRARLEEILIVTYTERATAELVARVRATLEAALQRTPPGGTPDEQDRRARLVEALRGFDQASITTIHAFCQGLLRDEPLATGRLPVQARVDAQAAFGDAFRDVLRRVLSTDPGHRRYLDAYLAGKRDATTLEGLLFRAQQARGAWATPHDQAALERVAEVLARLDLRALEPLWKPILSNRRSVELMKERLEELRLAALRARAEGDWAAVLDGVDDRLCSYLPKVLAARARDPRVDELGQALRALIEGPTLTDAIAQRFLPPVQAALEARKLAQGLYDFDDMIGAAVRAVEGPGGDDLVAKLRRRFRFALIDEAQDTDALQWRLFRRVFLDSAGANPCVLIGDPKQAIYGFRGADVHSYVRAREEILARGGVLVPLGENHRSAREVLAPVNAILEQQTLLPFFTHPRIAYDRPVESARGVMGDGAGVTLLQLDPIEKTGKPARVGVIKQALRRAIAAEIARLRSERPGLPLRSVFVLTRTNVEAREVGGELRQHGIAYAFYRQEGLWKTPEAEHVRTLLVAIDDPLDRRARLQAWLTPFFGLTLADLEAFGDPPPHHPLMARLFAWKRLGDARDHAVLFADLLDGSGVTRRLRLGATGERTLTLYRQLLDLLLAHTAARRLSLRELAALIGRYAHGQFPPAAEGTTRDTDIQRADLETDAVQIITMHKAKGLEAEHVFIYGALTNPPIRDGVHTFYRGDDPVFVAGKPRAADTIARIRTNRDEENQRLLYVALTRARHHLYLPFFPTTVSDDSEIDFGTEDRGDVKTFDRITGAYRLVNDRLRHLANDSARFAALFSVRPVPFPTPELPAEPGIMDALRAWAPAPPRAGGAPGDAAALRLARRGFVITSYSRLKDAAGGYQPPVLDEDEPPVARLPPPRAGDEEDTLPGGAATGLFLHGVLEKAELGPLPPLAAWERLPRVRALLEAERRRWDREPRHLPAAARVIHAALTAPLALGRGAPLAGIAAAARVRREVDFLFSLADPRGGPEDRAPARRDGPRRHEDDRLLRAPGFVRGVLDVVFEHEDRAYFADWKSDVLPSYAPRDLDAHVDANYELQIRIYTVALFRLLGVADEPDCARRFGGLAYVFLRGLGGEAAAPGSGPGIVVRRPSYDEVRSWERELVAGSLTAGWT